VWFDAAGVPSGPTGVNGDYALNTLNGDVLRKTAGTWGVVGNIRGPTGPSGPAGPTGPAGPPGPAGGSISGVATLSVTHPGALEWVQVFSATGVLPSSRIILSIAGTDDNAENDPELLDVLSLWATPGTDQLTIGITFGALSSGPIPINWSAF